MNIKIPEFLKSFFIYLLWAVKALLAFLTIIFGSLLLSYFYFIFDLITSVYQKYQEDVDRDLSADNFNQLKEVTRKQEENYERMAKIQEEHERERRKKETSLGFLNKLVSDGLIREKDLLSLAGTTNYYQLFVYSASLDRLSTSLGLDRQVRKYPKFLESIGFVRLGKNSTFFLINKNNLKDERLKSLREFKKFLSYHFSKIRKIEWQEFLLMVKSSNKKEYDKLKTKSYKARGYLRYNFLLTETNMNPTNIGFVDGERMGLGTAANNGEIYSQILNRASKGNKIIIDRELKIKIKKVFEKQDVSILLEGFKNKEKDTIDISQDSIKTNLRVRNIIDFYRVNLQDLQNELTSLEFSKRRAKTMATQMINKAKEYRDALDDLGITI